MSLVASEKKEDYRKLSGVQKAAIVLMAMDEENATKILSAMSDEEIKEISNTMASLGSVSSEIVERLFVDFVESMSSSGLVVGTFDSTERLLMKALGKDRVDNIMEDIRGPAGRTTWDKLGNVNEEILATFLKNEYPQTIALVLTKIKPDHAARVLAVFSEDLAMDVIARMLGMEAVKKEVLDGIEKTLRIEFMSNLAKTQRRDTHEIMAEIFNNFDRATETKFMSVLEQKSAESAEKIRALMFTFEDLGKLDPGGVQTLMRSVDKTKLPIALKGASETIRDLFLSNMSERAAKMMKEQLRRRADVATGTSRSPRLSPGFGVSLHDHPDASLNGDYALTRVTHRGRDHGGTLDGLEAVQLLLEQFRTTLGQGNGGHGPVAFVLSVEMTKRRRRQAPAGNPQRPGGGCRMGAEFRAVVRAFPAGRPPTNPSKHRPDASALLWPPRSRPWWCSSSPGWPARRCGCGASRRSRFASRPPW